MKVIGLAGYAGVGKDTVGDWMSKNVTGKFKKMSFAQSLKECLSPFILNEYGFDILNCSREEKERVRDLLVCYAEMRRKEDPDYWVKKLEHSIKSSRFSGVIAIADVRYKNECEWIQNKLKGEVWLIDREGVNPSNATEKRTIPEVKEVCSRVIKIPDLKDFNDLSSYIPSI